MKALALPLTGGDNRCIRDAHGHVVSITENAEAFAHTMNCHQRLEDALDCLLEDPAIVSVAAYKPWMQDILFESGKGNLPPAPIEVAECEVEATLLIAEGTNTERTPAADLARAILTTYRVYPR